MQDIKNYLVVATAAILGFLNPVNHAISVLLTLCVANFILGWLSSLIIKKQRFSFRKAFHCFTELAIYIIIIAFVFRIGDKMEDMKEAMFIIKVVTYFMIYCYSINILKNLKRLFPSSMVFRYLYFYLAFEFVKKFPAFDKFLEKEKELKANENEK